MSRPDENFARPGGDAPTATGAVGGAATVFDPVAAGVMPATIGRFRLSSVADQGLYGALYIAEDPRLGRRVALTVLPSSAPPGAKQAMAMTAQTLGQRPLANIAKIFDGGEVDGSAFVATESGDGVFLEEWMMARPRAEGEVVSLFSTIGRALAAAHEMGVVHGSFGPRRVVVDPMGSPVLLGFVGSADPPAYAMQNDLRAFSSAFDGMLQRVAPGSPHRRTLAQPYPSIAALLSMFSIGEARTTTPRKTNPLLIVVVLLLAIVVLFGGAGAFWLLRKPAVAAPAPAADSSASASDDGPLDLLDEATMKSRAVTAGWQIVSSTGPSPMGMVTLTLTRDTGIQTGQVTLYPTAVYEKMGPNANVQTKCTRGKRHVFCGISTKDSTAAALHDDVMFSHVAPPPASEPIDQLLARMDEAMMVERGKKAGWQSVAVDKMNFGGRHVKYRKTSGTRHVGAVEWIPVANLREANLQSDSCKAVKSQSVVTLVRPAHVLCAFAPVGSAPEAQALIDAMVKEP